MDTMSTETTTSPTSARPRWSVRWARRNWPTWIGYAAALWSLGYGVVAVGWTISGAGFPLVEDDTDWTASLLYGLPERVGAPLFAGIALAGAAVAVAMTRRPVHWRAIGIALGTAFAVWWLLVVPDARVLALVGYLPMLIAVAPFNAELRADLGEALSAVYVNHAVAIAGGFLWAFTTLAFARRTARLCVHCGRGDHRAGWTRPDATRRWGRWAVAVAALVPALYSATRWLWAAGVPLGADREFYDEALAAGELQAAAWLGSFGLVGSVLTLGLVQRWGEVFPRWMPWVRGRRVPVALAVVPASLVAALVFSAGLGMTRAGLAGDMGLTAETWAMAGPALLWPLWGIALGAATLAYYLRRRGSCRICGRG